MISQKEKDLIIKQIFDNNLNLPTIYKCLAKLDRMELKDKIRLSATYPEGLLKDLTAKVAAKAARGQALDQPAAWLYKVANSECDTKKISRDIEWGNRLIQHIELYYPELLNNPSLHEYHTSVYPESKPVPQNKQVVTHTPKNEEPFISLCMFHNKNTIMRLIKDGWEKERLEKFITDGLEKWNDRKHWAISQSKSESFTLKQREVYADKAKELQPLLEQLAFLLLDLDNFIKQTREKLGETNATDTNTMRPDSVEETRPDENRDQIRPTIETEDDVSDANEEYPGWNKTPDDSD